MSQTMSLLAADVAADAAGWVPPSILLWALGISVAVVIIVIGFAVSLLKREVTKFDKILDRIDLRLTGLEKANADAATRPMLSSMGDRLETNTERVRNEVRELDKRITRLEVLRGEK